MQKLVIVIGVLLHYPFTYTNCIQIFPEDVGLYTAYCPPPSLYNSKAVEVYLIKNNKDLDRYVCYNPPSPCTGIYGHNATFNTTGSYFPLDNKNISDMRQISGVKCLFRNNDYIYNDSILIVAKPQSLDCSSPTFSSDNKNMSITCRTNKVFPQAVCTFELQNQLQIVGILNYSHVNYFEVVEYYKTSCTWTSPLSNFAVGQYQYIVSFYPNGTSNKNVTYGASLIQSFQLNIPKLYLSNECFNGPNIVDSYIKPGVNVYCICYLENTGFPPPCVKWFNSSSGEIGNPVNSTATQLNISPSNDNQTFVCQGSNYIQNGNVSVNYTVNYAVNPTACTVAPQTLIPTIWKICNKGTSINVTVFCDVKKRDVKPGIKSIISLNSLSSGLLDSEVNNTPTNLYRTRYDAVLSQAGNYTIGCQVQNSIFSEFKTTCLFAELIQVYAPPDNSPILSITSTTNNLVSSVQENVVYILKCTVLGGVPPVSNVTVSCGDIPELTQSGNIFTSPVTFTRNMTGQNCTCTSQHITGCYIKNIIWKQLNIVYNENNPENVNVGAAVGGTIAALVVIAIIVVIIVFLIRKKPNIFKRNKEAKKQQNPTTYSEISVSQSIHDRHTYETPILNENILPPDKEDKRNASYCNVTVNDVDIDYFNGNGSPYCNTKEVNQDLFKLNGFVTEDKEKEEFPYVEVE